MRKNDIVAFTGVTGVGKDYLVERANRPYGVEAVNLGTLIGKKLHADRDLMMSTVNTQRIRDAQLAVYKEISARSPLLVTCHAIRPQGGGYGYDLEMERIFNPSCYVLVTAPPHVIAERIRTRNITGERKSPELAPEKINAVQRLTVRAMEDLTERLDCELVIINNTGEQIHNNAQLVGQLIGGISLAQTEQKQTT